MSECHCNFREDCCCQEEAKKSCKCHKKAILIHLAIIAAATVSAILIVKAIRR